MVLNKKWSKFSSRALLRILRKHTTFSTFLSKRAFASNFVMCCELLQQRLRSRQGHHPCQNVTTRCGTSCIISCAIPYNKCICSTICPKNVTNRCVSLYQVNHSCAILIIYNKCMCPKICLKNVTNCCANFSRVYHTSHIPHGSDTPNACVWNLPPKM